MEPSARGVLWLEDGAGEFCPEDENWLRLTLQAGESRYWLSRAQEALWQLRRRCGWVCVAANRTGAGVAAALAAQLPVDRLALTGSRLFDRSGPRLAGSAARIERFARRNLALVVSEILLIGASEREIRGFIALPGRKICALEACGANFYTAAWSVVNENNLLIPGKCV